MNRLWPPAVCGSLPHFLAGQGLAEVIQDPASGETKYVITSRGVLEQEKGQG